MSRVLSLPLPIHFDALFDADLYQAMKDLARFAFFFTILAEYLFLTDVIMRFTNIEYRLAYGVRSELIPLVTAFPHLSRARARQLYQTGYTSPDTLQTDSPVIIAQKTHLPISVINSLQAIDENSSRAI